MNCKGRSLTLPKRPGTLKDTVWRDGKGQSPELPRPPVPVSKRTESGLSDVGTFPIPEGKTLHCGLPVHRLPYLYRPHWEASGASECQVLRRPSPVSRSGKGVFPSYRSGVSLQDVDPETRGKWTPPNSDGPEGEVSAVETKIQHTRNPSQTKRETPASQPEPVSGTGCRRVHTPVKFVPEFTPVTTRDLSRLYSVCLWFRTRGHTRVPR